MRVVSAARFIARVRPVSRMVSLGRVAARATVVSVGRARCRPHWLHPARRFTA
jgi:hypothetical protein